MYAIIDCNNFYASCERLFQPALHNKPIIVLSNNDGCVIARSNEAKELGIKMGTPYFKAQALCKHKNVAVFSSNYTLYGDMSHRVMQVIEMSWPDIEIYSIDEAFLKLDGLVAHQAEAFCQQLQKTVFQCTGIPVSIGIGPSKTLAKLANHIAKRIVKRPVFNVTEQYHWLNQVGIGDVWGVGRQWQKKLSQMNIFNAQDLAQADIKSMRKRFSVVMEQTILELRGIACLDMESIQPKKSIVSSRSFGNLQTELPPIAEALSHYVARATEKLCKQQSKAGYISVSLRTNPFKEHMPQYTRSYGFNLPHPTDDVRALTSYAKQCLKVIYKPGYHYQKVGVFLNDLHDEQHQQLCLFDEVDEAQVLQSKRFMHVLHDINTRFGRHTLRLAAEGKHKGWHMKSGFRSPNYTTSWDDLANVVLR